MSGSDGAAGAQSSCVYKSSTSTNLSDPPLQMTSRIFHGLIYSDWFTGIRAGRRMKETEATASAVATTLHVRTPLRRSTHAIMVPPRGTTLCAEAGRSSSLLGGFLNRAGLTVQSTDLELEVKVWSSYPSPPVRGRVYSHRRQGSKFRS